jgi:hypothetical protein
MTNVKTKEQIDADTRLSDAIQNAFTVYGISDDGFTLIDFVILTATQKLEDDGTIYTGHPVLMRDGDLPWYRILGLIEIHKKLMEASIICGSDNG